VTDEPITDKIALKLNDEMIGDVSKAAEQMYFALWDDLSEAFLDLPQPSMIALARAAGYIFEAGTLAGMPMIAEDGAEELVLDMFRAGRAEARDAQLNPEEDAPDSEAEAEERRRKNEERQRRREAKKPGWVPKHYVKTPLSNSDTGVYQADLWAPPSIDTPDKVAKWINYRGQSLAKKKKS
jgi:hypothetical protein